MSGLKVGQEYTLGQVAEAMGTTAMIVPSDRIVVPDQLEWELLTVGRLMEWLQEGLDAGQLSTKTLLVVDSDPEGNGQHPLRASAEVDKDGDVVWLGVGYLPRGGG